MQFPPQVVEGEREGLGPSPHHEHDDDRGGPEDEQERPDGEWDRGEGAEDERAVSGVDHIHYMSQEHEIWNLVVLPCIQSWEKTWAVFKNPFFSEILFVFPVHLVSNFTGLNKLGLYALHDMLLILIETSISRDQELIVDAKENNEKTFFFFFFFFLNKHHILDWSYLGPRGENSEKQKLNKNEEQGKKRK